MAWPRDRALTEATRTTPYSVWAKALGTPGGSSSMQTCASDLGEGARHARWLAYDGVLAAHGVIDYGGLITRIIALLRSDAAVAAALRSGLRHVLVDEYQDVNRAGAVLLQELVRDGVALWVVGDLRQAIYSFRGAEPRNISDFERDFPRAVRFTLDVNYRAVPALVDTASSVAQALAGREAAWSAHRTAGEDDAVVHAVAPDESSEQAGLAADIARSIAAGRRPEDHAVLCRTHRQAAAVAAALNGAGLPTSYLGAFFLRPEIKDLLALLALCCGPDGSALLRLATWPEYRLDEGRAARIIGAAREGGVPFPTALRSTELTSELTADERAALARLAARAAGRRGVRALPARLRVPALIEK